MFAVLTHRAGLAARLAHDHLVVAPEVTASLDFDPERPATTRCTARLDASTLEVDDPARRAALSPRLVALGALAAPLPSVDPADREKVRVALLGRSQLDAAHFPTIAGELVELRPTSAESGAEADGFAGGEARLRLTVHGHTVEKNLAVRWRVAGGELTAEALGEFRFTEFGIEPYSAVLGAVRNDDRFELYLLLIAQPATAADPRPPA